MNPDTPKGIVLHRRDLEMRGVSDREISERARQGHLVRVHRGWYAERVDWDGLFTESRHLARVEAVALSMRTDNAVFSYGSAAAKWELPLFRWPQKRVHTTLRHGLEVHSTPAVARHRDQLDESDVVERGGVLCTSLARTVIDVARVAPTAAAVSAADAALRLVAGGDGTGDYDEERAEEFRASLLARVERMPGARGIRQARWVAAFADGRAQLPGESVSRLFLHQLGFAPPRLQVVVPGPAGSRFYVDFGLDDVDAWGEFDGKGKYTDPVFLRGRTAEQAFFEEKAREDWIRGTTGRRFARWDFDHLASPRVFAARLAAFGIRPV